MKLTKLVLFFLIMPLPLHAQDGTAGKGITYPEQEVVEADIKRRNITVPSIDVSDIEAGMFFGIMSFENFGSDALYGLRGAYHITEDYFLELNFGQSTVSDSVYREESAGFAVFPEEEQEVDFYNLSLGINLFPGEAFLTDNWAVGTAVYTKFGMGSIDFGGEDKQTFNLGLGLRFMFTDWLALHINMEDVIFESDKLAGQNSITHNFQLYASVTTYF